MRASRGISGRVATDAVGGLLALAALGWGVASAWVNDGDALAWAAPWLAAAAGFVAARMLNRLDTAVVPGLLTAAGLVVILVGGIEEIYSDRPLDGPWRYSAASAAFFVQCTVAALLLVADSRAWVKPIGLAAVPFALVPFATSSETAMVGLAAIPLALVLRQLVGVRATVVACGVLAVLAVWSTTLLGATYEPGPRTSALERAVDATLTERRLERQRDAWEMMTDEPLLGVGHGNYAERSASVARDEDAPWVHQDFLQDGAEAGVPAFLLGVMVTAWAFLRLRWSIARRTRSVIVAAGLLALVLHACTELILDRPSIAMTALALVGCALHVRRPEPPPGPRMVAP